MERLKIARRLGSSLSIDTDYGSGDEFFSIEELQEYLTESKNKGAEYISVTGDYWDEQLDSICIYPLKVILESDEEYNKRLSEQERRVLEKENKEKDLYEKLKLKYE